ncbi:MAG TPA: NnrS family protein, partial [Burkholderiaceae bacterium]|nr:NnrS family protein [Burkholderiaceae bacterium]
MPPPQPKPLQSMQGPAPGQPPAAMAGGRPARWSIKALLWAPHRMAFFLAMCVLLACSVWWFGTQVARQSWGLSLPLALSPSVTHAAVMSLGFFPMFFAGFLFTAGPKWLGVPAPEARRLLVPLGLQGAGWAAWLTGALWSEALARTGLLLALLGLVAMYVRFGLLVRASPANDRTHAQLAVGAGGVGVCALAGAVACVWLGLPDMALLAIRTGLWGCVVATYLLVSHRMLPFFTASALPGLTPWRPRWVLWLLLGIAAAQALAPWVPLLAQGHWAGVRVPRAWMLAWGLTEVAAGSVVLWLAVTWGLVQSLKVRLLAMLHVGFAWFGLALLLSGASQLLGLRHGVPLLGLG